MDSDVPASDEISDKSSEDGRVAQSQLESSSHGGAKVSIKSALFMDVSAAPFSLSS